MAISENAATDLSTVTESMLFAPQRHAFALQNLGKPVYQFDFFEVAVDYGGDPTIRNGVPKTIALTIRNKYKVMENFNLHWYLPDGWVVEPSTDTKVFVSNTYIREPETTVTFTLKADSVTCISNRCTVELSVTGRPTVMLVPILLLNDND